MSMLKPVSTRLDLDLEAESFMPWKQVVKIVLLPILDFSLLLLVQLLLLIFFAVCLVTVLCFYYCYFQSYRSRCAKKKCSVTFCYQL